MNMDELREQIALESEKAFVASIPATDEPLAFSRRGLRIYRTATGEFRVVVAPWYNGTTAPQDYVTVLRERDLETAVVDDYLRMTPEGRRRRLATSDRMAEAVTRDDGTSTLPKRVEHYKIARRP